MKDGFVTVNVRRETRDELRLIAARLSMRHGEYVSMADILADAVALLAAPMKEEEWEAAVQSRAK